MLLQQNEKKYLLFIFILLISCSKVVPQKTSQQNRFDEMFAKITFEQTTINTTKLKITEKASTKEFIAIIFTDKKNQDHVLYEDKIRKKTFLLKNLPMPHRPITSLKFVSPGLLGFNRWSSPHYGLRYLVDCHVDKIERIIPIADRFFKYGSN